MESDREPWEQQRGESGPAFEAFAYYRDQSRSQRSITTVARGLDKSRALIGRWSSRWSWQSRVQAYDTHQDRLWTEEQAEARRDMARRQAQAGADLLSLGQQRLTQILEDMAKGTYRGALPNYNQIARLIREGTHIERLALGEATEKVEADVNVHVDPKQALYDRIAAISGRASEDPSVAELNGH